MRVLLPTAVISRAVVFDKYGYYKYVDGTFSYFAILYNGIRERHAVTHFRHYKPDLSLWDI